jgi:acyl-CoA reductase-like NAD-dependent aldehyde dehydrogenase
VELPDRHSGLEDGAGTRLRKCRGHQAGTRPADLVPASVWALVEIISRTAMPKGVVNLAMGRGSVVGQTLLDSRDVAAISFTGSVETGARVAAACAARGAKFQLEMGGKNPLVVLDDANLDAAVVLSSRRASMTPSSTGWWRR